MQRHREAAMYSIMIASMKRRLGNHAVTPSPMNVAQICMIIIKYCMIMLAVQPYYMQLRYYAASVMRLKYSIVGFLQIPSRSFVVSLTLMILYGTGNSVSTLINCTKSSVKFRRSFSAHSYSYLALVKGLENT